MKPPNSTMPVANTLPQELKSAAEIDENIRRRAFELYEQRGRKDGSALDDWLQAQAELLQGKPNGPAE